MALPELTVIEIANISPPPGSVPESSLPLTFLDVGWLFADAVERVFFFDFPHPTPYFVDVVLPNLKSSLSIALRHFYPLSGKIRISPDSGRYEIHYADGDSIPLTVAEISVDEFNDLKGDHAVELDRLLLLVPKLPKSPEPQPLVAFQATIFPGRGLTIAMVINHAVCDGSSSMSFMSYWASACKAADGSVPDLAKPPIFDRSIVSDPEDLYTKNMNVFKSFPAPPPPSPAGEAQAPTNAGPSDTVYATFTLKEDQIKKLKDLVMAKAGEGDPSFRVSTIMVSYAYTWLTVVKTRCFAADRTAYMIIAADCRSHMKPPLPATYFGNSIAPKIAEISVGEMVGEDGFVATVKAIGKVIKEFKESAMKDADQWIPKMISVFGSQPLATAGSPNFKVYGFDFGFGKPSKVDMTSIRTGSIAIAESREGGGGLEIGFTLPKKDMEVFAGHFSDGLEALLQ